MFQVSWNVIKLHVNSLINKSVTNGDVHLLQRSHIWYKYEDKLILLKNKTISLYQKFYSLALIQNDFYQNTYSKPGEQ